jgi:hypothetical protein
MGCGIAELKGFGLWNVVRDWGLERCNFHNVS